MAKVAFVLDAPKAGFVNDLKRTKLEVVGTFTSEKDGSHYLRIKTSEGMTFLMASGVVRECADRQTNLVVINGEIETGNEVTLNEDLYYDINKGKLTAFATAA